MVKYSSPKGRFPVRVGVGPPMTKHKIITAVCFIGLIVVGFVVWYSKQTKQISDNVQELRIEEIDTNLEASAQAVASSSPDFARRMAINELPDIGNLSNYKKDENYVYFGTDTVVGADPKTFEIINKEFAKDKNHIYYEGDMLEDSDSATFVVGEIPKDKSNVYLFLICEDNQWDQCYQKVEGADPATFEPIKYGFYKDKSHIFYNTKLVSEADINTFVVYDGGKYGYTYGYDKNYIFVIGYNRVGVIREKCIDLRQIGGYYLRCDDKVYYVDKLLIGADAKTMIPIGSTSNYAKDSKTVYFDGEIVVGADTATFGIGDGINAKDKNYTYRYGKRIN